MGLQLQEHARSIWIGSLRGARRDFRYLEVHVKGVSLLAAVWASLFGMLSASPVQATGEDKVIARLNGEEIYASELEEQITMQLHELRQAEYELRRNALDNLVAQKLIDAEAARRGFTIDELQQAVVHDVTVSEDEIDEAIARGAAGASFGGIPGQIEYLRLSLKGQKQQVALHEYFAELMAGASLDIYLTAPEPLRLPVSDSGPSRGNPEARVTIVEFADFQCPYCRQMHKTLTAVLADYTDEVRLVYKHLPLQNHPHAFKAAQAAVCADRQQRFWTYHDRLFDRSPDLSLDALNESAEALGLDMKRFDVCLSGAESRDAVRADMAESAELRATGTPTLLVNGRLIRGVIPPEELRRVLDEEMRRATETEATNDNRRQQ